MSPRREHVGAVLGILLLAACTADGSGEGAGGAGGSSGGGGGAVAEPDWKRAIDAANVIRSRAGLPPILASAPLELAARAHASFYASNVALYDAGLSPHAEPAVSPGATGTGLRARALHAGYEGSAFGEVMNYRRAEPAVVIAEWMDSVYHRIPFVHPNTGEAGYGAAETPVQVMDFGRGPASPGQMVPWPPDGATEVPTRWYGYESPQPATPPGGWPSGPVVTLCFPEGAPPRATVHELLRGDGSAVEHTFLDPAVDDHLGSCLALYANEPLQTGTRYTVHVSGTTTDPFDLTWSFTTLADLGCDPFAASPCPTEKTCGPSFLARATDCVLRGKQLEREECYSEGDCAEGLTCLSFAEGTGFACYPICIPDPPDRAGTRCSDVCEPGGYRGHGVLTEVPRVAVCFD